MIRPLTRWLVLTAGLFLLPTLASAAPPEKPARLFINDNAKMFSVEGISAAKKALDGLTSPGGDELSIETFASPPDAYKKRIEAAKDDKQAQSKVFYEWAESIWREDKAHGVLILLNRVPGHVTVLADKSVRDRGLTRDTEQRIAQAFGEGLKTAVAKESEEEKAKGRDTALLGAVKSMRTEFAGLKKTASSSSNNHTNNAPAGAGEKASEGSHIMQYVCIGIAGLLVVWLVIGIFRALTGGGNRGGQPGYAGGGGGYGGGGGGGGFMTSLLGGMFGAAAGMYLYDQFSGHSHNSGSAYGNDNYNGGDANNNYSDPSAGQGDLSGDAGGSADYDGGGGGSGGSGGGGGGDWGGGGGWDGGGGSSGGDFGGGGGGDDF